MSAIMEFPDRMRRSSRLVYSTYVTEASSEWTRLDDAHNNLRSAKEDMEIPPNINNLVFDGGIQFDLLADVPIRQPMKKRADVIKKSHEIKFKFLLEAWSVRECFRQGMGLGVQA